MLINSDEIHSMKETNEKNVVICVYVDCNVSYEKYPDFYEIVALWPYSEAFNKLNQRKHIIMEHVNRLAVLIDQKADKERIVYLSLFYLSHRFKDITGYSFRDWLNFVRVEKAEKLLLNTSLPITEIAYQCGFSDVRSI